MEWAVGTVLPREVRKLVSAIEEKDAALALLNDDLQNRDNQIQAIQYKKVALQARRDMYQAQLQKCQDTIIHLKTRMFLMREIQVKITLSSLYGNTKDLPTISFMIYHITLRGYNDVKGM